MSLDIMPDQSEEQLFQQIHSQIKEDRKKAIKNILKGLAPERYILFLLEQSKINPDDAGASISTDAIRTLTANCKHFTFKVNGTLPLEKAFVTGGGVSIKEIEPKTMQSKLMNRLFFCGEVLDIYGYTGGYNITSALVTGRVAGLHAGESIQQD